MNFDDLKDASGRGYDRYPSFGGEGYSLEKGRFLCFAYPKKYATGILLANRQLPYDHWYIPMGLQDAIVPLYRQCSDIHPAAAKRVLFFRFYTFYRATARYDLTVIRGLRKIIYELELNIEVYKTCSYRAVPLAILATIAILAGDKMALVFREISSRYLVNLGTLPWVFLVLLISQVITIFFLNLHIRLQYGRYLAELKAVVYELDAEEL